LDVIVTQEQRRRGIAERLLSELFSVARAQGTQEAFLEVRRSNRGAQALYAKFGFRLIGERRGYYADQEDALVFRCCFPPAV
jgi:ribosomal-protein-alanine N-acetyltransferase